MAQVHFSRGKSYELATDGEENPTEYLESEGERLIKQMVQKQLNKQVTLKEQLQEGKAFESCAEFVPLTKLTSGQISFSDFKELAEKASHIEDLKSLGLTEKEIDFLNDYERGESYFVEKYRKIELSALQSNLKEIHKKVDERLKDAHTDESGCNERGVSRHELELSLSVKPQSDHTKLLQFALSCQQTSAAAAVDSRPLNHPIHSLKELERELFGHLKAPLPRKRRKRPKKHVEDREQTTFSAVERSELTSLWDKRSAPQSQPKKYVKEGTEGMAKVYKCAPKRIFTIKDKKIVPQDGEMKESQESCSSLTHSCAEGKPFVFASGGSLPSSIPLLPLEQILSNKMKDEDMAEYPYFKSYSRGEPSQVLYVKNISPSVKEDELVALFGHFESSGESRISYRLMTGRMKGQAFITFPTVQKASQALETVNGYYCKGKPLVVQFGKSKK